tara:strand:- start:132 stop:1325 length:1194 start_codon:yes stop_codon:yes gene_type:complete
LKTNSKKYPDEYGRFGKFGGRYIPETLVSALDELKSAYKKMEMDDSFQMELAQLNQTFTGRPTPLYYASNLTRKCGGAKIFLKREDLAHTGAHKINNALGQALLATRMGKKRIIAETGAGQHGVASATACAMMNLECIVYMGKDDIERQALNVFRMKLLNAEVRSVDIGSKTLKDAINEAIRDWVTNVETTYYLLGSAVGPHPYPQIVRDFQSVIGKESRTQIMDSIGKLPDHVIACVGGGSNSIGMFHSFINDDEVALVGVEAGGIDGKRNAATLVKGRPGILHGAFSYLLQDSDGQVIETHSISAGLDYPGVGPEHSFLKDSGRASYVAVTDGQALKAFKMLCELEGIIPALESSHAVYHAMELAASLNSDEIVLVCLSGRGDKDIDIVLEHDKD